MRGRAAFASAAALAAALAAGSGGAAAQAGVPIADFVLVDKSERVMTLFTQGHPTWQVHGLQFGDAPQGHKRFEGDERTPEGRYTIDYGNPQSRFFLSLHISYPNAADRVFAAAHGRSPGGAIFIHGQPNGSDGARMDGDWTDGCIAVSDAEMEALWRLIPDGTPIEIRQ
ncbi:L,D-transpeptidase family protein [Altererythrobacter aerius]|uniref:L,D-transpeptidase family protein n=1 Tax=Tsuneonella aeria TaxID=1837929 RepID=A0A6I4TD54_9SPHN|nr:L,D-transpeptidase family protein [Tsuneonella aeria]MXO74546.1 L,D-transpeptidase family protein [Tsuneonella aeria]